MKPAQTCLLVAVLATATIFIPLHGMAQPNLPTRTMTVEHVRDIEFGMFYVSGSNGSISLNYYGTRTSQGGVVLINSGAAVQSGAFTIKLCPGRNVEFDYNPTVTLTSGSNTLTMTIDSIEGLSGNNIYTTSADCDLTNLVRVGGTITVPVNTPSGNYQGPFTITFILQ